MLGALGLVLRVVLLRLWGLFGRGLWRFRHQCCAAGIDQSDSDFYIFRAERAAPCKRRMGARACQSKLRSAGRVNSKPCR